MLKSETIKELATALAKAQGQMGSAKKDASNPFFKSKYADLAAVVEAVKGPFSANGLSYCQFVDTDEQGLWIETILMHSSGEWLSGRLRMPVAKQNDPQALGSAVTYGRRYGLQAAAGVPADDDDGNAATGKPGIHRPSDGAMEGLGDAEKTRARTLANGIVDAWESDDFSAAAEIWNAVKDSDIKVAAWSELGEFSKKRNAFKAYLIANAKPNADAKAA